MKKIESKTIVLIHGAFVTSETWDEWKTYYSGKGYHVIAPPWPHKDASANELRRRHPGCGSSFFTITTIGRPLYRHHTTIT